MNQRRLPAVMGPAIGSQPTGKTRLAKGAAIDRREIASLKSSLASHPLVFLDPARLNHNASASKLGPRS